MILSVIGGGSWGSAFALHLGRLNLKTKLLDKGRRCFAQMVRSRENQVFLPGRVFPETVSFHQDLKEALTESEIVFIAVPSEFCRSMYTHIAPWLHPHQTIVSLTKGIEKDSLERMSEIMREVFPPQLDLRLAALSGPSFAREVAESHPTAVVVASANPETATTVQHLISSSSFRAYASDDLTGVELAGALKNVIAIAAGICTGLEFGSNSIAALITRGIAETTRLSVKLGAKTETFAGLAGIGDLVLTCTGKLSRNRFVGHELGKGNDLKKIVENMKMVAEGIGTTLSVHQLAEREAVEMPIAQQIYQIIYQQKDPRIALQDLMSRELKNEFKT